MDTRRLNTITKSALQKTLSLDSLYENIRLNRTIPTYRDRLREGHAGVRQLLAAIQTGDSEASVFDQQHCYIYLLHLLDTWQISESVFLTVYFYLLALMQYTDRQPVKDTDQDIKVTREFAVDRLVQDGKLTKEAQVYIAILTQRFAELGYSIDQLAIREYILGLPPTEHWLLRIKNIKNLPEKYWLAIRGTPYYSSESLQALNSVNLPFLTLTDGKYIGNPAAVKKKNTAIWVPSVSIMQYMLCVASPRPIQMRPIFGTVSLEKLHQMHAHHEHPVQVYAYDVKLNLFAPDRYRAGPLVSALHDVGHAFYGSLLQPADRDAIFSYIIPFIKKVREQGQNDAFFDYIIERLGDLDTTPIKKFYNPATRFKDYLTHCLTYAKRFSSGVKVEYLLMHRIFNEATLPAVQREHISHIMPRLKKVKTIQDIMLIYLMDNDLHHHIDLNEYDYLDKLTRVDWRGLRKLLGEFKDPTEFFEALWEEHSDQFTTLVIRHGVRFFHPEIPLTEDKRAQLEQLVDEQLAKQQAAREARIEAGLFKPRPAVKRARDREDELQSEKPSKQARLNK